MESLGDSYKTIEDLERLVPRDVDVPLGDNWRSSGLYSVQAPDGGNGSVRRYLGIQ